MSTPESETFCMQPGAEAGEAAVRSPTSPSPTASGPCSGTSTSSVPAGALMAIVGPNGAGKTTLIKAILGPGAHRPPADVRDPRQALRRAAPPGGLRAPARQRGLGLPHHRARRGDDGPLRQPRLAAPARAPRARGGPGRAREGRHGRLPRAARSASSRAASSSASSWPAPWSRTPSVYFMDEPFQGVDAAHRAGHRRPAEGAARARAARWSSCTTTCRPWPSTSTGSPCSTCGASPAGRWPRSSPTENLRLAYGGRVDFLQRKAPADPRRPAPATRDDRDRGPTGRTPAMSLLGRPRHRLHPAHGGAGLGRPRPRERRAGRLRRAAAPEPAGRCREPRRPARHRARLPAHRQQGAARPRRSAPPWPAGWPPCSCCSSCAPRRIKLDTALGLVLSTFFGLGLVLLSLVQRTRRRQPGGPGPLPLRPGRRPGGRRTWSPWPGWAPLVLASLAAASGRNSSCSASTPPSPARSASPCAGWTCC